MKNKSPGLSASVHQFVRHNGPVSGLLSSTVLSVQLFDLGGSSAANLRLMATITSAVRLICGGGGLRSHNALGLEFRLQTHRQLQAGCNVTEI